VEVPDRVRISGLLKLWAQPGVQYVVPNFKLHSYLLRSSAYSTPVYQTTLKEQWAIGKVNAEKAWAKAGNKGNRKVLVAVIDTGADYKHESLAPNMVPGYDFKENDNDPMDKTGFQNPGHGTHCAGAIGATGLIEGGIIGLAPEISLMPLRFLGEDGSGDLNAAIKAIDYAIEKGVHVISASWGATVPRSTAAPLLEAIKRADDKGIIFVSAAANDGANNDKVEVYPANNGYPNSITVAASNVSDAKPQWSNYGKANVHVASPGENIMSTLPGNKYGNLSGTSMATPLVAGLVALLKSQDMSLTGAQIRAILQTTGVKVKIETACNCRVDAETAVAAVLDKALVLVPSAATLKAQDKLNLSTLNGKAPFEFTSSNPAAVTVDSGGLLTAVADGTAVITVKDADGKTATSLDINVGGKSGGGGDTPDQPDNPGMPGGDQCPIQDPQVCEILCKFKPELHFCKK
jgi:thermitase